MNDEAYSEAEIIMVDMAIVTTTTTTAATTTSTTTTTTTETTTTTVVTAEVKICKQDIHSVEIPGATLTLTGEDKDGNAITFEKGTLEPGEGAKVINGYGQALIWKSGTEPTNVKISDGTYVLHELAAPTGYEVATDIKFVI